MATEDRHHSARERLPALWVKGGTKVGIAEELGVHRDSVSAWLAEPEIQEEIEALQKGMREAARRAGASLLGKVARVWDGALNATTGALCAECGEAIQAPDHAIRLRAADSVADRFGLPKTEVQEVVASLTMADKDDAQIEAEVLIEAAAILDRRGAHELAAQLRATG